MPNKRCRCAIGRTIETTVAIPIVIEVHSQHVARQWFRPNNVSEIELTDELLWGAILSLWPRHIAGPKWKAANASRGPILRIFAAAKYKAHAFARVEL